MFTNGNFFYTGGFGSGALKYAWEIHRITFIVKEHASMNEGRLAHAMCNFKNVIYVFGGYNRGSYMESAEKFDSSQTWELIAPLNSERGDVS